MDSLYQEIILDHYRNPVGRGLREPFEAQVHHVNPTCGDEITLRVHLDGDGESATVVDISYDNQGCSSPRNCNVEQVRITSQKT